MTAHKFKFIVKEEINRVDVKFFAQVAKLLDEHGLGDVFGIRDLKNYNTDLNVEVTENNANLMLPCGSIDEDRLIITVWKLGLQEDDSCNCMSYCFKEDNKHLWCTFQALSNTYKCEDGW
ncbi:hypothetical protein CH63R_06203 [Colletotrichum higginsianum IMI 349063]|uniref:Uncharacterized protein n=1 Tax=Colletotrichum higginsianum (strain IMI 349063) TaxID=759273 RepID=A0A1B7YEE0_COLHI|nr:hypothetical protein CH63R_06203 [Colletotrichum higginsianum IMI 349063]OBR10511.1 hypothetical protein CH63R_06203 [Colletotrichum higginsianum IMI 349063]